MTGNPFPLTLIASSAICLMPVRYSHYTFLRCKYAPENFMRLNDQNIKDKPKEAPVK